MIAPLLQIKHDLTILKGLEVTPSISSQGNFGRPWERID
jgi:hypothetical protein